MIDKTDWKPRPGFEYRAANKILPLFDEEGGVIDFVVIESKPVQKYSPFMLELFRKQDEEFEAWEKWEKEILEQIEIVAKINDNWEPYIPDEEYVDVKKVGKKILAEMPHSEVLGMVWTLTYCRDHTPLTTAEKGNCERWLSYIEMMNGWRSGKKEIDLEELLNSVPMTEIFEHFGIPPTRWHYNRKCMLPNHTDWTASFKLYPGNKWFYCFGCGRGGWPIQFIQAFLECDRSAATKYFINNFS